MRLVLLLTLFSVGCALAPKKPSVYLCVIDTPRDEAICGWTGEQVQSSKDLEFQSISQSIQRRPERIPLSRLDKHIAFSPDSWAKVKNYMDELRLIIESNCQRAD